jgi:phosphoribosyl-ATP pyrophosphohydrolase
MGTEILDEVFAVIEDRRDNPKKESYVSGLISKGEEAIIAKIEEEADELIEAGRGSDKKAIVHETADLIFHAMVLLAAKGVKLDDIMKEFKRRRR